MQEAHQERLVRAEPLEQAVRQARVAHQDSLARVELQEQVALRVPAGLPAFQVKDFQGHRGLREHQDSAATQVLVDFLE